jgi:HPt (histidine-containing phosphotransfer) domain-containing protein
MHRKTISARPWEQATEITGEAGMSPQPQPGEIRIVPPLPPGGTHAERPGETSRPLRMLPLCEPQPDIVHAQTLAAFARLLSAAEFAHFLRLYLVDSELHMLEIARARARDNYAGVAREAGALGRAARNLGVLRLAAAARRLEDACRHGDHGATYRLIAALSRACDEAGAALRAIPAF